MFSVKAAGSVERYRFAFGLGGNQIGLMTRQNARLERYRRAFIRALGRSEKAMTVPPDVVLPEG